MRLGLLAGMGDDWRDTLEKVKIAEDLGYERVSCAESWSSSPLPWLAAVAVNTSRIEIGTSILNCFSRSPAALAQEFASLDKLSDGRSVLGLGSSGELVIEHLHGVPFKKPLTRLREYVDIFNMVIAQEPLNYSGELFELQRGFKLRGTNVRSHIPVYIAAITPKSIHQTGQIADGIIPIHWPKQRFATLHEQLAEGAAEAGRSAAELTIAPQVHLRILDGRNDEKIWQSARQPLQYYINRMGVFYHRMLTRNGFAAEVAASREAWANRDVEGSFAAITDDMVREIEVVASSVEEARDQLHERSELGADLQMLHMPSGTPSAVGKLLEALIR
jgi:alkanesulfonate monooxygenase SsuD/methylene tetrahydromethanopterin reductase-like flavin-dependent oxidoreductase (luciferase family)